MITSSGRLRPIADVLATTLLVSIALTACAGDRSSPTDRTPPAAATPTPSASPTQQDAAATEAAAAPAAEPTDARPTEAPGRSVPAGTVASGVAATAEGKGNAEVTFERDGEFAVVAHFDCSRCTDATVLTGPDRMSPFGESDGALSGSYLLDVFEDSATEQSLWLVTDGPWSLRFESWNDLAPVTGEQAGEGSTVLAFGETASGIDVTFTPAGPDDAFSGRYFSVSGDPLMFGDSEAFTDSYEVSLPGVLAITTDGSWQVVPQP